jgi:hypothetical protein
MSEVQRPASDVHGAVRRPRSGVRPTSGRSRLKTLAALVLVGFFFALSVGLQAARTAAYPSARVNEQFLYVQSGPVMRHLTLAFNTLAADVYWIRALQHYGGTKLDARADKTYPLLYPLLDLTTSLDPRFSLAYRFGAIFLAEPFPNGPGRPDLAVKLLEKGLRVQPRKWEYMQDIGFVYYWWHHDYVTAAHWFERASEVPDAPWFLRSLAATTLGAGGKQEASRLLWQQIYEHADNDWLRQDAAWRLQQLTAIDQIDRLQALVDRVRQSGPSAPVSWGALVRARVLTGVPVDPSGVPYEIDAATGEVTLSARSPLRPLPTRPGARRPQPSVDRRP